MVFNSHDEPATTIREITRQAADAVAALIAEDHRRFWRSTEHRDRERDVSPGARFPTVSLCSSQALMALRLQKPEWCSEEVATLADGPARTIPLELDLNALGSSALATPPAPSPFTVAQHLEALALVTTASGDKAALRTALTAALEHPSKPLEMQKTGPQAHPFVLYHLARAITGASLALASPDFACADETALLFAALEHEATRLLADHFVGRASPAQIVALAFCGAGLAQDRSGAHDEYAISALAAAGNGQEMSGCWALGRVVREHKDADKGDGVEIEISTYEIAWAVSDALLLLCSRSSGTRLANVLPTLVEKLVLAASYARKSVVNLRDPSEAPSNGWCSDYPYNRPMIESWTSATVLRSGLSLDALLRVVASEEAMTRYAVSRPSDSSWPTWLKWNTLRRDGEMDTAARVLDYLHEHVVDPILSNPFKLPSSDASTVSALLFGPPGTSKTTVAKGVAEGLDWPVVELNPGVFIERGLELIEARAREVFDDLLRMERAVVLFDECDELFRARGPDKGSEQMRSITAFVTASMLPKLQQLHDEGRVFFVICTNNFAHLDPAIKRRGRVDHICAIGPPDEAARERIIRSVLQLPPRSRAAWARALWKDTERFTRSELLAVARFLAKQRAGSNNVSADLLRRLSRDAIAAFEPSLNISVAAYAEFCSQQQQSSIPHLQGGIES